MLKVTVYIPTFNYEKYVGEAINSVLKQTMTDWELIVIDDGSQDNTKEILHKFRDHPGIRIIEQENRGLNVTNNIALRLANGKYIMRLDADDYLDENALLVLSNILDSKKDIELVYPDFYHIDESGEILEAVRRKKIGEEVELLDLPPHGACTMIRKECLMELGGYIEDFTCQDGYELWLRIIQRYKPYNVNIPLFYYRQHSKSLTKKQGKILDTRGKIKKNFIDKYNHGKRPKVLGLIPVVGHSIYSQSSPFVELAGKPLIWYTLNEVRSAQTLDRIVLSSEDDKVLEYAAQFSGILPLKRPDGLSSNTSRVRDIVVHVLDSLKESSGYEPDAVCILYISTPLRQAHHINKAVDTLTIFDVDTVTSIQEELAPCYFHRRHGLTPVSKSDTKFRIERDAIYKGNGAITLSRVDVLKNGSLLGKKVGHITMLPEESIKINSEFEFWMAEKIMMDWRGRINNNNE